MEKLGYTVIQDWMYDLAKENDLRLAEVICFAVVFGFSQDGESAFTGCRNYMAAKMCVKDVKSVTLALERLMAKGLIVKKVVEFNRIRFNEYRVAPRFLPSGREKMDGGREKLDALGDKPDTTKISTRYNKNKEGYSKDVIVL